MQKGIKYLLLVGALVSFSCGSSNPIDAEDEENDPNTTDNKRSSSEIIGTGFGAALETDLNLNISSFI